MLVLLLIPLLNLAQRWLPLATSTPDVTESLWTTTPAEWQRVGISRRRRSVRPGAIEHHRSDPAARISQRTVGSLGLSSESTTDPTSTVTMTASDRLVATWIQYDSAILRPTKARISATPGLRY